MAGGDDDQQDQVPVRGKLGKPGKVGLHE